MRLYEMKGKRLTRATLSLLLAISVTFGNLTGTGLLAADRPPGRLSPEEIAKITGAFDHLYGNFICQSVSVEIWLKIPLRGDKETEAIMEQVKVVPGWVGTGAATFNRLSLYWNPTDGSLEEALITWTTRLSLVRADVVDEVRSAATQFRLSIQPGRAPSDCGSDRETKGRPQG